MTDASIAGAIVLTLYTPETAIMAQALGEGSAVADLAARLLAAGQQAQANAAPTLQVVVSPLEQGLLMGALRQCTCQFSMALRWRLQQAMVGQLLEMDAPKAL